MGTFSPGQEAAALRSKGTRYQRVALNPNGDSLQSPELAAASVILVQPYPSYILPPPKASAARGGGGALLLPGSVLHLALEGAWP